MLPKAYRLNKQKDFEAVFKQGATDQDNFLIIRSLSNKRANSRFGLIVSAKVAKNATDRNRLRRQLNEIIRLHLKKIAPDQDFVLIAKPRSLGVKYQELETIVTNLFSKKKLYGEKNSQFSH